ncbi:MAG: hemolysin III family protein, partial [Lachnospiraceae bacterium]|nr:hemolysin III family protein [Lachnospiraceae bacterium]
MQRTKLSDRVLPSYTKGEEVFNMVSHIIGAALSIAALVLCVVISAIHHDPWAVVGSAIYGA